MGMAEGAFTFSFRDTVRAALAPAGKIAQAVQKMNKRNVRRGAEFLRREARDSILRRKDASAPGTPFHTRPKTGRARRALAWAAVGSTAEGALIGYQGSVFSTIGKTHEFGGTEGPKKHKPRGSAWRLELGGYGPIMARGGLRFGKLRTPRQVERAKRIAAELAARAAAGPGGLKGLQGRDAKGRYTGGAVRGVDVFGKRHGALVSRKYPARPVLGPAVSRYGAAVPGFWKDSLTV